MDLVKLFAWMESSIVLQDVVIKDLSFKLVWKIFFIILVDWYGKILVLDISIGSNLLRDLDEL